MRVAGSADMHLTDPKRPAITTRSSFVLASPSSFCEPALQLPPRLPETRTQVTQLQRTSGRRAYAARTDQPLSKPAMAPAVYTTPSSSSADSRQLSTRCREQGYRFAASLCRLRTRPLSLTPKDATDILMRAMQPIRKELLHFQRPVANLKRWKRSL